MAPSKICPQCGEILAMNAKVCPWCFHEFTKEEKPKETVYTLSHKDINGDGKPKVVNLSRWLWTRMSSKAGNDMWQVRYYPTDLMASPICEYIVTDGSEWTVQRAENKILAYLMAASNGSVLKVDIRSPFTGQFANACTNIPLAVQVHKEGRYQKVDKVAFDFGDCIRWWDGRRNRWEETR